MRVDLHVHINRTSRCARHEPMEMAKRAKEVGLDGIVVFDHHYYSKDDDFDGVFQETGVRLFHGIELTYKTPNGNNDVVLISKRCPTFDIGAYRKPIPAKEVSDLREFALRGDCLIVLAHPFGHWKDQPVYIDVKEAGVDAIEIASKNISSDTRGRIRDFAVKNNLRCVAVSDAHRTRHLGQWCIELDRDVMYEPELAAEVKSGRYKILEKQFAPMRLL